MKQPVAEPDGNVAPVNESEVPVRIILDIPQELYSEYEDLASGQQLTVTELIMDRLRRCKSHSSIRNLYFAASHVSRLEALLQKRPIADADHAMALLVAALSVRVGDLPPVPISAQQAKRLSMSAYGGLTVHDKLCQIVTSAIAKATGV